MKKLIISIISLLVIFLGYFYFSNGKDNSEIKSITETEVSTTDLEEVTENKTEIQTSKENNIKNTKKIEDEKEKNYKIDELTKEEKVVEYIKENGELPEYYVTKKEARNLGWDSKKGNLCDVAPLKAIGGDIFSNREKILPVKKGRVWYEADLDYQCGRRNANRVLFSNDGLILITNDHYKSFRDPKN